ncbi:ribbon-helix-helix protein, CopG family [Tychonema sp. LEGE 07199]|uniref:ribbon-helix-helix protein, CopG family n=1 Tax=unclassified Tychonema TaxID=2642144 RepID=UPI0018814D59|nr:MULTISPECIES: ribbon-helix-helix protein, CopG family [unclassified Tychonema]MBE9123351.1 ribbon-helix-helix protein, CopG family [Tychonema sp. LEGE 07199]MBE9135201.1 ribbon-helix-helix protein, CopG family [Tychonema sp. LEGE 07196]
MVKKNRNVVSSNSESKVKVGLSLTPSSADRLNTIARKLGISRSELLERLAKGALDISKDKSEVSITWKKDEEGAIDTADLAEETAEESQINEAVTAETLSPKVSIQPNPLQESYDALQQQLSEKESALASLQQELAASKQNVESQLQETVAKSSYEALQQQLSEKENALASLQQELAASKQNLEQQLPETVAKSSYEALQQQLSEKENALASLQQQLASKQNLEQQLQETVSKSSYEALQHKLAETSSAIDKFQAQLTKLPYLENQLSQSAAKQRNYDALQQQSQEQIRTIKALREQLGQMQAVAGIGEAYLNKWRRP